MRVSGDAALQFGSGGITTIAAGSSLELDGANVRVLTGGGASSALSGLTENDGTLTLRGKSILGTGGASLTTTTSFTNYLNANVDGTGGDGGSAVTFGGTLTNGGMLDIGNASLSASTSVNATTLANSGTLIIQGNATSGTTNKASLILSGAAASSLAGVVRVSGDAELQFGGGGITAIGAGSSLELDGSQAAVTTSGGANSALSGLAANNGTLTLQGRNSGFGAGGASLTTTTAFTNYLNAYVDMTSGDGGSAVTFGGTLSNEGAFDVGNTTLSASTTVAATTLANSGTLILQGNAASGTVNKASLALSGAAASTLTGTLRVSGDASLQFASGGITSIGHGASLELDGSQAVVTTSGGASSALLGLATSSGALILRGGSNLGAGGASLTTTTSFANYLNAHVDSTSGDGGSAVTFGGTLTNGGTFGIGNATLAASTAVSATTLANSGTLILQGNASSGTTKKASLVLSGAAASTSTGTVRVGGDATLQFGSGGITSIGHGASLELDGSQAAILTGGGASPALSGLAANSGTLTLQGRNTNFGAGGVSLTTTTSFTNYSNAYVDSPLGDGGSAVTFGGTLTNGGTLDIGNASLSASTAVNATTLINNGALTLQGNASSGTTLKASLTLSGAAPLALAGAVRVSGDATLQFGSGGITSIGHGASLELDGSLASVAISGGAANSALSGLATNSGTLTLQGKSSSGANGVALTTSTAFSNYGNEYVDYGSGDGASAVTFGGALTNGGTLDIGNTTLSASTTVTAPTLANTGTLILQGNATSGTTSKASLDITGLNSAPSTLSGAVRVSGDATLQFGSSTSATGGSIGAIGAGASLELDGSAAQIQTWTGAGLSSALSGLTENDGMLTLRGKSSLGAGGASLTTTTSFTNYLDAYVDFTSADGGSAVTFGGTLANEGTLDIGNTNLSAATTVAANALSNDGAIAVAGKAGSLAEMLISGAATTSGVVTIGAGAEISATGAFTQAGGSTTVTGLLAASTINDNDGLLDYRSPIGSGLLGALMIGPQGTAEFDAALSSGNTATFSASAGGTLALGNSSASAGFGGTIAGFSAGDAIDLLGQGITGLAYSGSASSGALTVTGATGTIATLGFNGSYTTSSFALASDGHGGSQILHT